MKVSTRLVALHPRNVFRISRAARRETVNVVLRIERDGVVGYGEASANAYYGEVAEDVARRLEGMGDFLGGQKVETPEDVARIWEESWALLKPSRAAQCALDVALWDWLGKRVGKSVCELAHGHEAREVVSFVTIGISEAGELEGKLAEIAGYPRVKIKADATGDLGTVRRVRAAIPEALIAVDANCAWGDLEMEEIQDEIAALNVEFIEQPLKPDDDGAMGEARKRLGAAVMADESCVTEADVERMPGMFDGFNIKLVKCGGITPGIRMARRGRELGLKRMVGCMLESSLLIAAGAVVAQVTEYADLDGAWLLGDDPVTGWKFEGGRLCPPMGNGNGLGIKMEAT